MSRVLGPDIRAAFHAAPSTVAVLLGDTGTRTVGLTVSSVMSVAEQPPMLAISLDRRGWRARAILEALQVSLQFLSSEDVLVAGVFSGGRNSTEGKTERVRTSRLCCGGPRVSGLVGQQVCLETEEIHRVGSSTVAIYRILHLHEPQLRNAQNEAKPLLRYAKRWCTPRALP